MCVRGHHRHGRQGLRPHKGGPMGLTAPPCNPSLAQATPALHRSRQRRTTRPPRLRNASRPRQARRHHTRGQRARPMGAPTRGMAWRVNKGRRVFDSRHRTVMGHHCTTPQVVTGMCQGSGMVHIQQAEGTITTRCPLLLRRRPAPLRRPAHRMGSSGAQRLLVCPSLGAGAAMRMEAGWAA